jgi:hypothetical protein
VFNVRISTPDRVVRVLAELEARASIAPAIEPRLSRVDELRAEGRAHFLECIAVARACKCGASFLVFPWAPSSATCGACGPKQGRLL